MLKVNRTAIYASIAGLFLASCSMGLNPDSAVAGSAGAEAARNFAAAYPTMYLRGTQNSWAPSAMELVAANTWEYKARFYASAGNAFKFDARGDWSSNWGDNNSDGTADVNGANIVLPRAGQYLIRFNDSTLAYSVTALTDVQLYFRHPNADYSTMASELRGLTVKVYRNGQEIFAPNGAAFTITGGGYAQPAAELRLTSALPGNYRVVIDQVKQASTYYVDYGILQFRADYRFTVNGGSYYSANVDVLSNTPGNDLTVHFREWTSAASYALLGRTNLPAEYTLAYEGFINGQHWWKATIANVPADFTFSFLNSNGQADSGERTYNRAIHGSEIFVEAYNGQVFSARP